MVKINNIITGIIYAVTAITLAFIFIISYSAQTTLKRTIGAGTQNHKNNTLWPYGIILE